MLLVWSQRGPLLEGKCVKVGRRRSVSCRPLGLQACNRASRRIFWQGVDVMTKPVAGPDSGSSVVLILDSVGSDPKSNSYEESE
jgi:hypothetical protein